MSDDKPIIRVEVWSTTHKSYDGWWTVFTALDVGTGTKATAAQPTKAVRRLMRRLKRQARHQRKYHGEAH